MPMIATRLPVRSTSWFQRAEWKTSPWKVSMPSMSGIFGHGEAAGAGDQRLGDDLPAAGGDVPALVGSSQRASVSSVSKANRSSVPDLSATRRR